MFLYFDASMAAFSVHNRISKWYNKVCILRICGSRCIDKVCASLICGIYPASWGCRWVTYWSRVSVWTVRYRKSAGVSQTFMFANGIGFEANHLYSYWVFCIHGLWKTLSKAFQIDVILHFFVSRPQIKWEMEKFWKKEKRNLDPLSIIPSKNEMSILI